MTATESSVFNKAIRMTSQNDFPIKTVLLSGLQNPSDYIFQTILYLNYFHENFVASNESKNKPISVNPIIGTKMSKYLSTMFLLLDHYNQTQYILDFQRFEFFTGHTGYILLDKRTLRVTEYKIDGMRYSCSKTETQDVSKLQNALFHIFNFFIHSLSHAIITSIGELARLHLKPKTFIHTLITNLIHNENVLYNDVTGYFVATGANVSLTSQFKPNLQAKYLKYNNLKYMINKKLQKFDGNFSSLIDNFNLPSTPYNKEYQQLMKTSKIYFDIVDKFVENYVDCVYK